MECKGVDKAWVEYKGVNKARMECKGVDKARVECKGVVKAWVECKGVDKATVEKQVPRVIYSANEEKKENETFVKLFLRYQSDLPKENYIHHLVH